MNKNEKQIKRKNGLFEQCQICENWVEVTKECYCADGKSYFTPLMGALDDSGRWICSHCWDALDVKKYGRYNDDSLSLYVFGEDVLKIKKDR